MKARLSDGYQPDWDIDLRNGQRGEQLVAGFLEGFHSGTVEVKNDLRAIETGNFYIEYECRTAAGWTDSGIRTSKAQYWALVIGETVVLGIPTPILRRIVRRAVEFKTTTGAHPFLVEEKDGSHPTRGVRLEFNLLLNWLRIELNAAISASAGNPVRGEDKTETAPALSEAAFDAEAAEAAFR